MTRRAVFWLLVAAQAVVPVGMLGLKEAGFAKAQTVLLQVQPVDPQDLLRGEYVQLTYAISRLQADRGTVYVRLFEQDGAWTGFAALRERPAGGPFIRGVSDGQGRITYGIEQFYVQEGTAQRYERAALAERLFAQVALDEDGSARLERLVIR